MKTFRRNRWRRATTCPSRYLLSTAALLLAALLPQALPLQAQERQPEAPAQEAQRVHVVRKGDTLWDLANFYLSDPFLWPEIYRLNTVVVEDPHWIYPAEELMLPGVAEVVALPPERVPGEEIEVPVPVAEAEGPPPEIQELRSIFVARELTRRTLVYEPSPPIPPLAVSESDFHRSGLLVSLEELGPRGEVVEIIAPTVVPTRLPPTGHRYDRVYLSHPGGEPPEPGDRVLLSRIERHVRPYGYVVRPTGIATIAAVHEDVSTAVIIETFDRVQIGNKVTLLQEFEMERGIFAEPFAGGPTGRLVALLDDQWVPTIEDIAFIDVGLDKGVAIGDEFEIFIGRRRSPDDLRLPEEHLATGRVVRVTQRTATLRLIEQRHPAIAIGQQVRLIRKMPS